MTFGSLFSGCGGLDLGLEWAGMTCKWQVEIDERASRVLAKHWPDVRRHDDVRTFPPTKGEDWNVDLIAGGDPCQENSNNRRGSGAVSPSLGADFIRVVGEIRPRFVLRENPSVVRSDAPWPWWRFRLELERIGYAVLPFRLRACCLGADHQRDRLFLFAELSDAEVQGRGQGERSTEGRIASRGRIEDSGARRLELRVHDDDQPRVPRVTDGVPDRVERLRGIGNAVVPQAAEWIGRRILAAVV